VGEEVVDKDLPETPGCGKREDHGESPGVEDSGPVEPIVIDGHVEHVEGQQEKRGLAVHGREEDEACR